MSRRASFTQAQILEAIQAAAMRCGQPLSHTSYDSVSQEVSGPSSARIIQRFGTWRRACTAAGVTTAAPARDYTPRWDRDSAVEAVSAYLTTGQGTYSGYQEWARADVGRPSGATVRNILGGWSAAKAAAQA